METIYDIIKLNANQLIQLMIFQITKKPTMKSYIIFVLFVILLAGTEPQSVELVIDGKTDKCSLGEDINFQFTGFGVVGKV
jgi:hypothetical protein